MGRDFFLPGDLIVQAPNLGGKMLSNLRFNVHPSIDVTAAGRSLIMELVPRTSNGLGIAPGKTEEASFVISRLRDNGHKGQAIIRWTEYYKKPNDTSHTRPLVR